MPSLWLPPDHDTILTVACNVFQPANTTRPDTYFDLLKLTDTTSQQQTFIRFFNWMGYISLLHETLIHSYIQIQVSKEILEFYLNV